MESIKEKLPMIIAIIVAAVICMLAIYFLDGGPTIYYTQIDNEKIVSLSATDSMKYEYTLKSYKENGKGKEISFKTSRELREDAFLELEVMPLVGVRHWKEVQYNELPEKVRANYPEN